MIECQLMRKRVTIHVEGKVQGVFFRKFAKEFAQKHALVGSVKNMSDGTVLINAEGEEKDLEDLVKWCGDGSRGAHVEHVQAEYSEVKNEFLGFEIRS